MKILSLLFYWFHASPCIVVLLITVGPEMQLPELFVERMKAMLGADYADFEQALQSPPPVSVRVNNKLENYKPSECRVPWCDTGYYLEERPLFTADPLLHAGVYYVQEASSMFLKHIAKAFLSQAENVLDLCAAPGGKSTLLLESLPDHTLLVSNEIIRSRAQILAENITKWGNSNVVVTNNAPKDFRQFPGFFDAVLVDAPCSGEGMFRKDAGAIKEWSMQNVQNCAIRQKSILQDVWGSLKDSGLLIYSTCTYNREENEEQIAWICGELGAEHLKIDISDFDGIVESDLGYRFYPHKVQGEGLFMAVLRKNDSGKYTPGLRTNKVLKESKIIDRSKLYSNQILNSERFEIIELQNQIHAIPKSHPDVYLGFRHRLNCLLNGVLIADTKGKDHIPAHQFALSKIINSRQFSSFEVDYDTAISYLKRDNILLPYTTQRSYVLIRYKQQVLGWVKHLGNRTNNMYPQHWRIKMRL